MGWDRESHKQGDLDAVFSTVGLDRRADAGVEFTHKMGTCHYLHIVINLLMTKLFK